MTTTTPAIPDGLLATFVPSRLVIREADTPIRLVVLPRVGPQEIGGHDLDAEDPEDMVRMSPSSASVLPVAAV